MKIEYTNLETGKSYTVSYRSDSAQLIASQIIADAHVLAYGRPKTAERWFDCLYCDR